jgi:MFS transporter, DHA1 family, inner membrane transport protein
LPETTHWASVGAILCAGLVAGLQVGKVAAAVPSLESDLGLGLAAIGWVMGVFALMGVLGGSIAGAVDSRFAAKHVVIIGCLMLMAGSGLGSLATTVTPLLATRVLEGAGFLTLGNGAPGLLQRVTVPKTRDLVLALWSSCTPVGIGLVLLFGPSFHNWRHLWLAMASLAAIAALLLGLGVTGLPLLDQPIPSTDSLLSDTRTTLASRTPVMLALLFATYAVQYFGVFTVLPAFLVHRIGVSIQVAGALASPTAVVNALGNVAAGVMMARGIAARTLIAVGTLAMGAAGAAIFVLPGPPALVVVCCLLFSAIGGLVPGSIFATAPVAAPEPRLTSITVGLIAQGSSVGQMTGPVIAGAAVQAFGWQAAAAPTAIAAALGGGLSMLLVGPKAPDRVR